MIPRTDHYIGRKFIGVRDATSGEECQWAVELDGSVLFRNYDEQYDTPSGDPAGLSLVQIKYTQTNTELVFGTVNTDGSLNQGPSIMLTADMYTIAAPDIDEIDPRADHTPPTPPDPSGDRVVAGPSAS